MKEFFNKIKNSILVRMIKALVNKIIETCFNFILKLIDFIYTVFTKILDIIVSCLNAINNKMSSFTGVIVLISTVFVLVDIYKKDNAGVVNFVITKCIEIITAIAQALQLSGGVLIGGAIVILIFLQALKRMGK
jgi:hypothetical protein